MPLPNLARTIQQRARTQAATNTESREAVVTRTYASGGGNIYACDVQVLGQVAALVQVPNNTASRWGMGDHVLLNSVKGSPHQRQIIGAAGSSTAATQAAAAANPPVDTLVTAQDMGVALGGLPFLLQSASDVLSGGYLESVDANIALTDTPPAPSGSAGMWTPGTRRIKAFALVAASLPTGAGYFDGQWLDLVDSYGQPRGMYRWDAAAGVWRRRDAGALTPIRETPAGAVDGANRVFTLAHTPGGGFESVYLDGDLQDSSLYALAGNVITFGAGNQPITGQSIRVTYFYYP